MLELLALCSISTFRTLLTLRRNRISLQRWFICMDWWWSFYF